MNFSKTENQQMIADMVRNFGEKHIKPHMMDWDESQEFPVQLFKELGKLGLMGVLVPEEYGGSGFGYYEYVTAIYFRQLFDGCNIFVISETRAAVLFRNQHAHQT